MAEALAAPGENAGHRVVIIAHAYGQPAPEGIAVLTGAGGSWSFRNARWASLP